MGQGEGRVRKECRQSKGLGLGHAEGAPRCVCKRASGRAAIARRPRLQLISRAVP